MPDKSSSGLKAAASKMLGGSMAVVIFQAVNFALLARSLGVVEYGVLATINSIAALLLPLAGLGYGSIMLMRVSRDRTQAPTAVGNALLAQFASGAAGAAVGALAVVWISSTPIPPLVAFVVLLVELAFMRTSATAAQLFNAIERQGAASLINVAASLVRVVSIAGAAFSFGRPSAMQWAWFYLVLSVCFSAALAWLMVGAAGGVKISLGGMVRDLEKGADFSLGTLAKAIYTDADKLILARFGSAADVGIYAAAYRVAAMAFMPVRAILDAAAGRFFRSGESGIGGALQLSRQVLRFAFPYSVLVSVAMILGAGLLPMIFGAEYENAVGIMRLLAILPIVQSIHYTLSDALSGSGHQRARMLSQFSVVVFYLVIALLVIPSMGAKGAAFTCLASEGFLAMVIGVVVWRIYRREAI